MKKLHLALLLLSAAPASARAEPTLELRLSGPTEIFPGDPETASVDAAGRISMGLLVTKLAGGDAPIMTLLADKKAIYAGTAGGGLLEIDPAGKAKKLVAVEKLVVSALAMHKGALFFATQPDGAIAQVGADGKDKPFFDPVPKYIWAILSDPKGLIVATGEPGLILEVGEGGKSRTLLDPGETHVRALIRHPKRGVIAGGGQKGVIYQLRPDGGAYALYDSGMEETTALAVDAKTGDLYASFVSEAKPGSFVPDKMIGPVAQESEGESPIKGSEVVRIAPDGRVDLIWSSRQDGALGLAFDEASRRLMIATGTGPKGRGRIYAIDTKDRDRVLLLARVEPSMATTVALAPGTGPGMLVVGTAPSGQVLRLGPGLRTESTYVSSEQDLHRISRIGRVWFDADVPPGAAVEVSIRSGNTRSADKTWSEWSAAVKSAEGGPVEAPQGRFVQLRAKLTAAASGPVPTVKSLHASIIRMNVAPTLQEVFLLRRGVYMKAMPKEEEREKTVTVSQSSIQRLRSEPEHDGADEVRVRQGSTPGMLTASWRAEDRNGDDLLYRVELRRVDGGSEGPWQRLADGLETIFYSFDSRAYPDGRYQLRLIASDRPSNPPGEALSDQNLSEPFTIDNGPPLIRDLKASSPAPGRVRIEAEGQDAVSPLGVAELSLNGGPWLMLPASDGLVDSRTERFAVEIGRGDTAGEPALVHGRQTVLVRVEDEAGNSSTASTSVEVQ